MEASKMDALMETGKAIKPHESLMEMSRDRFNQLKEMATFYAESDLIPKHFQNKPANVFVAFEYAARADLSPYMTMQNIYVVYGRPGLEGKLVLTLINTRGGYDQELQYDIVRDKGKIISCTAWTMKRNRRVDGVPITATMVKAEGWDQAKPIYRDGKKVGEQASKWVTMPEMMYRYRAATYFARINCPEVLMGLQTSDEIRDSYVSLEPQPDGTFSMPTPLTQDVSEDFWGMVKNRSDATEDMTTNEKFLMFFSDTKKATGLSDVDLMQEAMSDFDGFWGAWEEWIAKKAPGEPEATESSEPTSSEPREGTIADQPDPNPSAEQFKETSPASGSPDNRKTAKSGGKITPAQEIMIKNLAQQKGIGLLDILKENNLSDLSDASFDQAGEILVKLK